MFAPDHYCKQWDLAIDGHAFVSRNGQLLPVRRRGVPAMLKILHTPEERIGSQVMAWWNGDGAAAVLAHDGEAILMERAMGSASLVHMAHCGHDAEATKILCGVTARLHAPRAMPIPPVPPLAAWFAPLWREAATHGGILVTSARAAQDLLAAPRESTVLHGDLHHGNVLDFGSSGWLAIDPKGVYGERGFDYANIFCNPNSECALAPERFARRLEVAAMAGAIDRRRLAQWILAWAGLSASWSIEDGADALTALDVARLAAWTLGEGG